jgi:hydroxypyruvate reductase
VTTPLPRFAEHRTHVAQIRTAALAAVDPAAAVRRWLSPADWAGAEKIYIVGAGKAGVAMALATAELLGGRLTAGVMAVPQAPDPASGHRSPVPQHPAALSFIEGGHPQPTTGSLAAGRAIQAVLSRTGPRDLVLALISGGGSALLELPQPGLTLADLQQTNAALLRSGAAIHEVNLVRTELSQLKGGGLARLAHPARVLTLILSDVVGNPLASIASGPTVVGAADPAGALEVVRKYGLEGRLPPAVVQRLAHGTGPLAAAEPAVEHRLIGSNRIAGEAAVTAARRLGFEAAWLADDWQGEARQAGACFAQLLAAAPGPTPLALTGQPRAAARQHRPRCLVAGGETTVTVRGHGKGGRNQEAALGAAFVLAMLPNVAAAMIATDGVDGPTDAAGALVTGATLRRARRLGLDPQRHLDDNDTYPLLAAVNALLLTGPTGTNVNDLMVGLVY